ncbi:hypothetical protein TNCV_2321691 [Trichonephila clavipes]|nr:hypothetical protein TNCV_2321691 [Trichonephila clavipes]
MRDYDGESSWEFVEPVPRNRIKSRRLIARHCRATTSQEDRYLVLIVRRDWGMAAIELANKFYATSGLYLTFNILFTKVLLKKGLITGDNSCMHSTHIRSQEILPDWAQTT